MNKIAFIGVGVMGKPMVQHLTSAGYDVTIYTRTKSKVQDLIDLGITWKDSVYDCIQNQDIIMTMVGYPHDVKDIYYGPKGIINNAKPGAILIDLTTSSPKLAKAIYNDAKAHQLESLDAPVSGGDLGEMCIRDRTGAVTVNLRTSSEISSIFTSGCPTGRISLSNKIPE